MRQKTILILIAILAITIPISVSAMIDSWIDYDCDTLTKGQIPICNDINDLNYRLTNLEGIHHEIIDNNKTDSSVTVGTPFVVEGFTAHIHNTIDWTDKIKIQVIAPNSTKIVEGVQPLTFTPDRNGNWIIQAFIIDDYNWSRAVEVTGGHIPIIDVTLTILYTDDGDYLQVNATGFYYLDYIRAYTTSFNQGVYGFADSEGKISFQFRQELNSYLKPITIIDVEIIDYTTPSTGTASILYDPIQELQ